MRLPPGKVPVDVLQSIIFKNLGSKRKEVVLGPHVGIDGAIVEVDNRVMITSMDPITGALPTLGETIEDWMFQHSLKTESGDLLIIARAKRCKT